MNKPTSGMPDVFDRMLGSLEGLPDVVKTKSSTLRVITPLIGAAQTFIVQTFRQKEQGDTIFLEGITGSGSFRIALPPQVADTIARQRDSLTDKARSKGAKQAAQERKQAGHVPFQKKAANA